MVEAAGPGLASRRGFLGRAASQSSDGGARHPPHCLPAPPLPDASHSPSEGHAPCTAPDEAPALSAGGVSEGNPGLCLSILIGVEKRSRLVLTPVQVAQLPEESRCTVTVRE